MVVLQNGVKFNVILSINELILEQMVKMMLYKNIIMNTALYSHWSAKLNQDIFMVSF